MFIETIIAVFLFGALAGAVLYELVRCQPLREHNEALKQQQASRSWEAEKDAIYYQAFTKVRREHKGTPYIREAQVDDHNGSRRAPQFEVVS